MMGPISSSNTGTNGTSNRGFITLDSGSARSHIEDGRGGGRGIPRQRTLTRNYKFSPNYNPPRAVQSPMSGREWDSPSLAPVLQEKRLKNIWGIFCIRRKFRFHSWNKLKMEFPMNAQQDCTNDISMYFKRFATVLLAAYPSISILNWEHPTQSPAKKAVDISPNEASIKKYFSGVVVQANRHQIKGFVKIKSTTPFSVIKRNDWLWAWLTKNKVFVRMTQLTQSRYVNIGWCLHSHAEYSNQELARADLQQLMGREGADFELVHHSSSHITSDSTKITTKSMKIRADCNVR